MCSLITRVIIMKPVVIKCQFVNADLEYYFHVENDQFKMIQLKPIIDISPKEIQQLANNYGIKKNLRDYFPFPYLLEDATNFLELVSAGKVGHVFAIVSNDKFIGIGSLIPQNNEHRFNAEIGYWIGEPYWGRGYATAAVNLLVQFAFSKLYITRVFAYTYSFNNASMRVLEKSGFHKEAVLRSSIIKEGQFYDEHLYSIINQQNLIANEGIRS